MGFDFWHLSNLVCTIIVTIINQSHTIKGLLHIDCLSAPSLSPSLRMHCNSLQWQLFSLKMTIFSNLTKLTEKVNLLSFQSKWSGLKKKVILSENSCHCNELQCILYEGDKLGADIPLPINVLSFKIFGQNWVTVKEVKGVYYLRTFQR